MSQPDGKGQPLRVHHQKLARKGDAQSARLLEGPDYPAELEYLRGWVMELHGRSGASMSGLLPLSYSTISAWATLKHVRPEPYEVEALVMLDSAMLHPGEE